MVAPAQRTGFEISSTFVEIISSLHAQGARIGFIFGRFEMPHPGNLHMLRMAVEHCDILIVAIWRDESFVEAYGRKPIFPEMERSALIGFYEMVNFVITYDPNELLPLIEAIQPDTVFLQTGDPFFLPADATFKIKPVSTHGEYSMDHILHELRRGCFYYDEEQKKWAYNMPDEIGFPTFYARTLQALLKHLKKNFNMEF
jgi:cytidyltransferase-like protein